MFLTCDHWITVRVYGFLLQYTFFYYFVVQTKIETNIFSETKNISPRRLNRRYPIVCTYVRTWKYKTDKIRKTKFKIYEEKNTYYKYKTLKNKGIKRLVIILDVNNEL